MVLESNLSSSWRPVSLIGPTTQPVPASGAGISMFWSESEYKGRRSRAFVLRSTAQAIVRGLAPEPKDEGAPIRWAVP